MRCAPENEKLETQVTFCDIEIGHVFYMSQGGLHMRVAFSVEYENTLPSDNAKLKRYVAVSLTSGTVKYVDPAEPVERVEERLEWRIIR
jgi:hypothetical protein